jgi:LEA14-like dessication related protein
LSSISYTLYGNNNYLGSGNINQQLCIAAGQTTDVPTTITLSYIGGAETVWSVYKNGGTVHWEVKGTASFNTAFGPMNVPFDFTK